MKALKFTLLTLLFLSSGFVQQADKPAVVRWVITRGCSLTVAGSTNVNKFTCAIPSYSRPDTITLGRAGATGNLRMTGNVRLDVQDFDCRNQMMTADLRKTLKSKLFPKMNIRFISLAKYPDMSSRTDLKGVVEIELAGVTKVFDVNYRITPDGSRDLTLVGTRQVKFSDFNIVPPRKLGGMIQTNNELAVEFNLRLKVLN